MRHSLEYKTKSKTSGGLTGYISYKMKAKRRFYIMFVGIIIVNMVLMFHSRLVLYEARPVLDQADKPQNGKQKISKIQIL